MSLQPTAIACHKPWDQVVSDLQSDSARGLSSNIVAVRQAQHGINQLVITNPQPWWHKLIEQFQNPLIYLLLASASISFLIGEWDNAISITLAIVIVATVAFVQEYKSEQSLQALNTLVPHHANCIRDGQSFRINATELVPGDICTFSTGDRISADIRLIETFDFQVDESTLTGETKPVRKFTNPIQFVDSNRSVSPVADRKNVCYMGTLVKHGHGTGIVVGIGRSTEFGAIFLLMREVEVKKTPLQGTMDELGKQLSLFSAGVILIILLIGWGIQGRSLLDMFTISVSLAVAAIPEGLPIVVTVTLALGVLRLAEQKAIVKSLPSIETLSCVNVLCVDKTGTLTTNQMTVAHVWTLNRPRPTAVHQLAREVDSETYKLAACAIFCNTARTDSRGIVQGQATDVALLNFGAMTLGLGDLRTGAQLVNTQPFSSETKCMITEWVLPTALSSKMHNTVLPPFAPMSPNSLQPSPPTLFPPGRCSPTKSVSKNLNFGSIGRPLIFMKGSLESVLAACETTKNIQELIQMHSNSLSREGLRVIALAYGHSPGHLTFLGLVSIHDPPRHSVPDTIRRLQHAGVRVVMMTGDAMLTASTIAQQVGLLNPDNAMSGDAMGRGENGVEMSNINVFYRMSPAHKLSVVQSLQRLGLVVAVLGDGVNDAPALRLAEIGISMGQSGTDVSKEAADMILVNDDLSTMVIAIEEGKTIFHNIRNFLSFQLSTSISALSLVAIATFLGLPNPLNAMQILWINIIMDGPPAQSLGVEPVDKEAVENTGPRPSSAPIITRELIRKVLISASVIVLGTLVTYYIELSANKSHEHVTTMTFTMFVMNDMFNALTCRSLTKSVFRIGIFSNRMFNIAVGCSILGHFCVLYIPLFQSIFQTVPLTFRDWIWVLSIASLVLAVDEVRKGSALKMIHQHFPRALQPLRQMKRYSNYNSLEMFDL